MDSVTGHKKKLRWRAAPFLWLLFILFSFDASPFFGGDPLSVVVSLDNPILGMTRENLQGAYLGEIKKWEDGSPIIPLNLIESHPASGLFREMILKKTEADLEVFWIQQIFSEKGSPPVILKDDREVKEYVASHKGAIGYLRSSALDASVKSILVDGKAFIE